jgi:hypothetical protein
MPKINQLLNWSSEHLWVQPLIFGDRSNGRPNLAVRRELGHDMCKRNDLRLPDVTSLGPDAWPGPRCAAPSPSSLRSGHPPAHVEILGRA